MIKKIRVVSITGHEFYIEDNSTKEIKDNIEKVTGIPLNEQKLINKDDNTWIVSTRLRGGQVGETIPIRKKRLLIGFSKKSNNLKIFINKRGVVKTNRSLIIRNISKSKREKVESIKTKITNDNLLEVVFISKNFRISLFQQQYQKSKALRILKHNKRGRTTFRKYPCNYYCIDKTCAKIVNGCQRFKKEDYILEDTDTKVKICNLD